MNIHAASVIKKGIVGLAILVLSASGAYQFVRVDKVRAATTPCIVTVFGQQYDVTALTSSHTGGNIFVCGTDMTATYQAMHGTDVSRILSYLITPTPTPSPTVTPGNTPTASPSPTPMNTTTPSPSPSVTPVPSPVITTTPSPSVSPSHHDEDEDEGEHEDESSDHDTSRGDRHESEDSDSHTKKREHHEKRISVSITANTDEGETHANIRNHKENN
jgi:hypothetical protein